MSVFISFSVCSVLLFFIFFIFVQINLRLSVWKIIKIIHPSKARCKNKKEKENWTKCSKCDILDFNPTIHKLYVVNIIRIFHKQREIFFFCFLYLENKKCYHYVSTSTGGADFFFLLHISRLCLPCFSFLFYYGECVTKLLKIKTIKKSNYFICLHIIIWLNFSLNWTNLFFFRLLLY